MSQWDWKQISSLATALSALATFAMAFLTWRMAKATSDMASTSKCGLDSEERREKSRRTPFLLFDFSDSPEHEGLGAAGFRHLQSKVELLVSGTIRNVGNTLAVNIELDIFHYIGSNSAPVHEICKIHVADALPAGGFSLWSRTIGNLDLTVEGTYYRSGVHGLFACDTNNKYNHFHVVFSCKNADGEDFCSIYCVEKIIRGSEFRGNQMKFVGTSDKYDPTKQLPHEWRDEIQKRTTCDAVTAEMSPNSICIDYEAS